MERAPVELSLSHYGQLGSLEDYLRLAAPGVAVTREPGQPGHGEQGALDVLTVLADSTVLVTLIKVLPEFLRSRKPGMSVDMQLAGKRLTLTADNAEDIVPVLDKFLDAGS
jgi:Effector Associated Constant Component 1